MEKGDFEGKLSYYISSQLADHTKYVRGENDENVLTSNGAVLCQAINKAVNSQFGLVILRHDIHQLWNKRSAEMDAQVFEDFASQGFVLAGLSYDIAQSIRDELGHTSFGSSLSSLDTQTCPLIQLLGVAVADCTSIDNDASIGSLESVKILTYRINLIRKSAGNNPITPHELVQNLGLKHKLAN